MKQQHRKGQAALEREERAPDSTIRRRSKSPTKTVQPGPVTPLELAATAAMFGRAGTVVQNASEQCFSLSKAYGKMCAGDDIEGNPVMNYREGFLQVTRSALQIAYDELGNMLALIPADAVSS